MTKAIQKKLIWSLNLSLHSSVISIALKSVFNPSRLSSFPVINPTRNVFCYWVNWGGGVSRPVFPLFLLHNWSASLCIMRDCPSVWGWFIKLHFKYLSTVTLSVMLGLNYESYSEAGLHLYILGTFSLGARGETCRSRWPQAVTSLNPINRQKRNAAFELSQAGK